jgi:hypothetical protein
VNLGRLLAIVFVLGIVATVCCGCGPKETPPQPTDNLKCRCEGLAEFFIRGRLRSSISLGGGDIVVTGDVECTLHCVVDPIEAEP